MGYTKEKEEKNVIVSNYEYIIIQSNYLKFIYTESIISQTLLCISVSNIRYCACVLPVCLRCLLFDPEDGGSTFFRNISNFYYIAECHITGDSTLQTDISDLLND
jgi:hypothetical protein